MAGASRHPEAERLAGYVDRVLTPEDRADIERHLAVCEDCRTVVAEAYAFSSTERADRMTEPRVVPFRRRRWLVGSAVALATAAALVLAIRAARPEWLGIGSPGKRPELQELIAALANEPTRPVEGRLTGGFKYAPPPAVTRGAVTREFRPEVLAAARTLEGSAETASAAAQARVAALLVLQRPEAAIEVLEKLAADAPRSASIRSDLAASYIARASSGSGQEDYERAQRAAGAALALDGRLPEARFNYALALERLGRRDAAAQAWRDYLAVEHDSKWSTEGRQHLSSSTGSHLTFEPLSALRSSLSKMLFQLDSTNPAIEVRTGAPDYPASFYTKYAGGYCTATFVGEHVALTAAHCFDDNPPYSVHFRISGRVMDGTCIRFSRFSEQTYSGDWALCYFGDPSPARPYEVLNTAPELVREGNEVLSTGFGGGETGVVEFRPFKSRIKVAPSVTSDVIVLVDRHLEGRDSGGAGFAFFGGSATNRVQTSTNSTINGMNEDRLCGFASDNGHDFLMEFAKQFSDKKAWICGAYRTATSETGCRNPAPPNSRYIQ